MWKFSNGVVVFTKEDKERFVEAGYVLVEEKEEEKVEDNGNDGAIDRKSEQGKKTTSKFRK